MKIKGKLIIFSSSHKQLPHDPDIRTTSNTLKPHQFVKYLGLFIGEFIFSKKQINVLSRANRVIATLRHFFKIF